MAVAASVPFFSPAGAAFGVDLAACLRQVVDSGLYVLGPRVRDFEAAFADYVGVPHAIGVANGTDALVLALRALEIGAGSRVALVANAGYYGSAAAATVGAAPLYVDVDAATLTMAPADLVVVRIRRQVPLTQGVSLAPYSPFPAKSVERALDSLKTFPRSFEGLAGEAEGPVHHAAESGDLSNPRFLHRGDLKPPSEEVARRVP